VNVPVPVPSVVLVLKDTFGLLLEDQTTPLTVTDEPPSDVTLPPLIAPKSVIEVTVVVDKVASAAAATVMVPVAFTLPQPPVNGIV
jgi:hypothetical protein